MAKLKAGVPFETTFATYVVEEKLGEGGAGIVYGGVAPNGDPVAVKVLREERASSERRARFKNEIGFLVRMKHRNVVSVIDNGVARGTAIVGPFYVMKRYSSSLRSVMKATIPPDKVLPFYAQILDGVEAAHLAGAVHRDLKPENVLYDSTTHELAVADFGVASFTDDLMVTTVETTAQQRLANVMYAAPEQRVAGRKVGISADIFALGMMLNEMFTSDAPHGQGYKTIASVASSFGYLDEVVAAMLNASPDLRPTSIATVKAMIERLSGVELTRQRISQIDATVIKEGKVDNPLAQEPPILVGADWKAGALTLTLDRPVDSAWIDAIQNHLGSYSSVYGKGPEMFRFGEKQAVVSASASEVQNIVDQFKPWLPQATRVLAIRLQAEEDRKKAQRERILKQERDAEAERVRVVGSIRI